MTASVVLGAGFSCAADVPLTRDLFDTDELPTHRSSDYEELRQVMAAFQAWQAKHPTRNGEEWLADIYPDKDDGLCRMLHGVEWETAIRFALRRLVKLKKPHPDAYYHGVCTHQQHPNHAAFWAFVTSHFDLKYIVSMNYDILVEQALHAYTKSKKTQPRWHYGGFQYHQIVRKLTNVSRGEYVDVHLGHDFIVYKLHGSINWAWERHSNTMKIHNDVRAVFRLGEDIGVPAIVPPVHEKDIPAEFGQVWSQARKSLMASETWIVCGYSMPVYDQALARFFAGAADGSRLRTLHLIDPNASSLSEKWAKFLPEGAKVVCHSGLPTALNDGAW